MPPKRKRAGEEATATTETTASSRATRASTRGKAVKEASESTENGSIPMDTDDIAPPTKKPRASAKGTTKTTTKKAKNASKAGDDDESGPRKPSLTVTELNTATQSTSKASTSSKRQKTQSAPTPTPEPYSPARAVALFDNYADGDDNNVVGAEGLEKLCGDANIALDGPLPLILAWQFGCQEMARITREEWASGTSNLKISSPATLSSAIHDLDDLLLGNKPPPAKKSPEPYNRSDFWRYCANPKEGFKKFYFFCFQLAKPEGSRNIDIETALAMWSVLLAPKYPIMSDVLAFVGERQGTYKAANKDLWSMMLEFCDSVNPNLTDYESDGAWPTLLDDFVSWKKESGGDAMQTD